jgi:hypothetical protein
VTVTREELAEDYPDLLFCDGLDEALIGVCHRFGQEPVALYDRGKIIEILMRDSMTWEEAEEYFGYNVIGAWVGDRTPAFADLATEARPARVTSEATLRQLEAYFKE